LVTRFGSVKWEKMGSRAKLCPLLKKRNPES